MHPEQITGYEIRHAKTPILITIRPLESLRPHEEVVPGELSLLSDSINRERVLRHPIIADIRTGVVLDGTHRLIALKQSGYRLAPVGLVDYLNERISIDRWYRHFTSNSRISPHDISEAIRRIGLQVKSVDRSEAQRLLENREVSGSIEDISGSNIFYPVRGTDKVLESVRWLGRVERLLLDRGFSMNYSDVKPAEIPEGMLLLSGLKLQKQEVINVALSGSDLYPPKSTRHLIPSRPLGTRVPIEWLRLDSLEAAQARLLEHLARLKLRRLQEGSTVGSRRYEEEVFLFE